MSSSEQPSSEKPSSRSTYRVSPLISSSILGLYLVLLIPLPILAQVTGSGVSSVWLMVGMILGAVAIAASLSECVEVDDRGIALVYPRWVPVWYRRGWQLAWSDLQKLQPRSTSQGGLVYYLVTHGGQAYLLPSRILGFAKMMLQIGEQTGFDTTLVRPLAQPWMYGMLAGFALLMGLVDLWVVATAWSGNFPVQALG
jgi:hypothetical protein